MDVSKGILGETPEYIWLMKLLNRAFPKTEGRVSADLHLIMTMCKAEPQSAQYAMLFMAQRHRELRHQSEDTDDNEELSFVSFALGTLFTAYLGLAQAEGRIAESDPYPLELEPILTMYPEVLQCAEDIGPI